MSSLKIKKLLPKNLIGGVAPKPNRFENRFSKSRGYRKSSKIFKFTFLPVFLAVFFSYQPTLTIPPIKKNFVEANSITEVTIEAGKFNKPFQLPHAGYISQNYSNLHKGIDIAAGLGLSVQPINDGVVEEVIISFWGYGHHLIIDHGNGLKSLYAHLGDIYAKKGQIVTIDTKIGVVGMTGHTSGPHTHIEVYKDNQPINPLSLLPPIDNLPKAEYFNDYTKPTSIAELSTNSFVN